MGSSMADEQDKTSGLGKSSVPADFGVQKSGDAPDADSMKAQEGAEEVAVPVTKELPSSTGDVEKDLQEAVKQAQEIHEERQKDDEPTDDSVAAPAEQESGGEGENSESPKEVANKDANQVTDEDAEQVTDEAENSEKTEAATQGEGETEDGEEKKGKKTKKKGKKKAKKKKEKEARRSVHLREIPALLFPEHLGDIFVVSMVFALAVGAGFFWFVAWIPSNEVPTHTEQEGIQQFQDEELQEIITILENREEASKAPVITPARDPFFRQ